MQRIRIIDTGVSWYATVVSCVRVRRTPDTSPSPLEAGEILLLVTQSLARIPYSWNILVLARGSVNLVHFPTAPPKRLRQFQPRVHDLFGGVSTSAGMIFCLRSQSGVLL